MATREDFIYFTLGEKRAMWQTTDGKIRLCSIPDETGKTKPYGRVSRDDSMHIRQVQVAIDNYQLMVLDNPPKELIKDVGEMINLSNKREDEIKLNAAAANILKLNEDAMDQAIRTVKDIPILKSAILLESKGHNKVKRKRDAVLIMLKKRLESLGALTEYSEEEGRLEAEFDPATAVGKGKVEE